MHHLGPEEEQQVSAEEPAVEAVVVPVVTAVAVQAALVV